MNVIIAGGGTGGHLFPGIAIAEEVRRRDPEARILFVGSPRGIEVRAVPRAGFDVALLPISGLRRMGLLGLVRGLLRVPVAMVKALSLVLRFRPQLAVSVGGYAAGPAVLAARLLGVPCVVMEQNAIAGFTNRVLGKLSKRVIAALPVKGFAEEKVLVLGNPVRADLLSVREQPYAKGDALSLLVFGGSQGARALNEAMMAAAPLLAQMNVDVVHQTGRADEAKVRKAYEEAGFERAEVLPFIDDMAQAYRKAEVVLCRAGATSVAELTVCGRPAILVPYPFAVDDHQSANARALAEEGAAIHLPQGELSAERLVSVLKELMEGDQLVEMAARARTAGRPSAAHQIVDALEAEARDV